MRKVVPGLSLLALVFAGATCSKVTIALDGLACDEGACASGYVCRIDTGLCVPRIEVGCNTPDAYCPTEIVTGDACPAVGAFLPCRLGATDCVDGCRTCGEDRRWTACVSSLCAPTNGGVELCDGLDNDCDGEVDEGVSSECLPYYRDADGDGYGVTTEDRCLCAPEGVYAATRGGDCDDERAVAYPEAIELCNNLDDDCDGFVDEGVPNCACADGGAPGAAELCDNGIDDDCNSLIDDMCCDASDTFTLSTPAPTCAGGDINVPLLHLLATASCANTLTSLKVERHAASNTLDDGLANAYLYHDVDGSGVLTPGDVLLAGPVVMTGGVLLFDDLDLGVQGGSTARLLVIGSRSARDSYFAAQVTAAEDFTTADPLVATRLTSTPLVGTAHSLAGRRCQGSASSPTDLGMGTQAASAPAGERLGVIHYTGGGNTIGWAEGAGSEQYWSSFAAQGPEVTADCNLQTQGQRLMQVRDLGSLSEYLHIDTGLPLGLPLCGLSLRVYASRFFNNQCSGGLLAEHGIAYLYAYDGRFTVDPASLSTQSIVAAEGPTTARGCTTDYADFDLSPLYARGASTDTLNVRFIVEAGGGIDHSDNTRINSIAELYLLLR